MRKGRQVSLVSTNTILHILVHLHLSLPLYMCVCITQINYILHNTSEEVPHRSMSPL